MFFFAYFFVVFLSYLTIPFGELTPEKMPASFIDERHFAEGAKMFDENSNGVDEIDKNSSVILIKILLLI